MSVDDLTSDDFSTYDLPDRPLRFDPDHRRNRREFAGVLVALVGFLTAVGMLYGAGAMPA